MLACSGTSLRGEKRRLNPSVHHTPGSLRSQSGPYKSRHPTWRKEVWHWWLTLKTFLQHIRLPQRARPPCLRAVAYTA